MCPVLLHSSNTERVYSKLNELRFAAWMMDRIGPLGARWIETSWLWQVRELLKGDNWRVTSAKAFNGRGSMGNGGVMRVAPLGAYFTGERWKKSMTTRNKIMYQRRPEDCKHSVFGFYLAHKRGLSHHRKSCAE